MVGKLAIVEAVSFTKGIQQLVDTLRATGSVELQEQLPYAKNRMKVNERGDTAAQLSKQALTAASYNVMALA